MGFQWMNALVSECDMILILIVEVEIVHNIKVIIPCKNYHI
jgi:hypothetical protein